MPSTAIKNMVVLETRLGINAATQPLSGTVSVPDTTVVNGLGRGGYIRMEEIIKKTSQN